MAWFRKDKYQSHPYLELFADKKDKSTPISDLDFLILDTETTGLDPKKDRILSIGALRANSKMLFTNECYHSFIQQDVYDRNAALIHGIRRNSSQSGLSEAEASDEIIKLVGDSIIVGHHIEFDIRIINELLLRHKGFKLKNDFLDTSWLYKRAFSQNYAYTYHTARVSLDELADNFGITAHDRHSALGDAVITGLAFLRIVKKLEKKKILTRGDLLSKKRRF